MALVGFSNNFYGHKSYLRGNRPSTPVLPMSGSLCTYVNYLPDPFEQPQLLSDYCIVYLELFGDLFGPVRFLLLAKKLEDLLCVAWQFGHGQVTFVL